MTSRSSKNRPTTRVNTLRWSRLESALLGACLAIASPMALFAQGPARVDRAVAVDDGSPRNAVDRWKRLKKLYPIQEANPGQEANAKQDAKPAVTSLHEDPRSTPLRQPLLTIPDAPASDSTGADIQWPATSEATQREANGGESQFSLPRRNVRETELPPPRPARVQSLIPLDEEPNWVLPAIIEREDDPIATLPSNDTAPLEPTHVVPAPMDGPERSDARVTPLKIAVSLPPETEQVSHSPVTAARYRKIGNIEPFLARSSNGQEIDQDIREWARGQSSNPNVASTTGPFPERAFPAVVMPWDAPNFFHYPLYFEDPTLERYGHTHHPLVQPVASIGRFGVQLLSMPYQMTIDPPCREVYSLGWYRPGECAPKLHYQVPLDAKAAAVQAATVTGLVFLVP